MNDPSDQETEARLRAAMHRLADSHRPAPEDQKPQRAARPARRRGVLIATAACLALLGAGLFAVERIERSNTPAPDTEQTTDRPTVSAPSITALDTTPPGPVPSGPTRCGDIPAPTLVGADGASVEMAVIFFGDSCGYDVDGDAMFDDGFRPEQAVLVDDVMHLSDTETAAVTVDVRPFDGDMILRRIVPASTPSGQFVVADDPLTFQLGASPCVVVTVDWRTDTSSGRFTALAESEAGACTGIGDE